MPPPSGGGRVAGRGALAAEETRRERRCGGAVARAAQRAAERASQLFAAAATGDEAALVKAVRDGAAAIAAGDAEVTLFGGAQCGAVERRETSLQIPSDHGPLGLVATGALDAAGRAELEAWCLLTGRALEQARALQAAAKSLREASANAARAVRAADAKALEAVDGARRAGGVLDAVAAGGDVEELVAAALDDGGADEIRARVVVPTAGSWEAAVCDRTPVGQVEAHGSAWCAPVRNGCLVVHAARPRPEHYAALVAKCAAIASRTRSKPAPRRARLRTLLRRAATLTQRRAWARWRSTWTCPRGASSPRARRGAWNWAWRPTPRTGRAVRSAGLRPAAPCPRVRFRRALRAALRLRGRGGGRRRRVRSVGTEGARLARCCEGRARADEGGAGRPGAPEDPTRRGPGRRGAGRYFSRPRAGAGGGPPEIAGRDRHQRRGAASRAPRAATLGLAALSRDGAAAVAVPAGV